jgi:hypothetical protein
MIKAGKRPRAVRRTPIPRWISDKENQRKWNGQFIKMLKRDYANSDAAITAIVSNERLSDLCATRIRFYVDKSVTNCLNEQTRVRGIKHTKQLEIAIAGLRAAIDLSANRGNQKLALQLGTLADDFSQELGRCKQAFATKRRGRDRDHSILYECRIFLESELRQSVTNKTLTNLVNIGYEADGNPPKDPITEEHVRKNLAHFKRKNPSWRNDVDPRFQKLLDDPETK